MRLGSADRPVRIERLSGNEQQNLNAEDAEDFAEERKEVLSSANLCEYLCVLCVSKTPSQSGAD